MTQNFAGSIRFGLLLLTLLVAVSAQVADAAGPDEVEARVFLPPQDRIIRLDSGRPEVCVRIEPINGSFDIHSVYLCCMRLLRDSPAPAVGKIPSIEASLDRDSDRNGIEEIRACFSKSDLRSLLLDIRSPSTVAIRVYGSMDAQPHARWFETPMDIEVLGDGDYRVRTKTYGR